MKQFAGSVVTMLLAAGVAAAANAADVNVRTRPPSVVKTVPQAGDTAVDPSLREVRVTPMLDKDGKWRISGYYLK